MLRFLLIAAAIACTPTLALACGSAAPPPGSSTPSSTVQLPQTLEEATVLRVIDGATIEAEIEGRVARVSYMGVRLPDEALVDEEGQSVRVKALEFNRFLVEGRTIELERDSTEADVSGTEVRYVYVGGEMVNKALITNGYATVADFPRVFRHQTEFLRAEENAKNDQRGIWHPGSSGHTGTSDDSSVPEFTGGTLPDPSGSRTCDYSGTSESVIKGNVNARSGERIYPVPGGFFHSATVIDEVRGDQWFCTEEQAVFQGWRKSKR